MTICLCTSSQCIQVLNFHSLADAQLSSVTVSAESVDGPTPAARVTWSTTAPPQCVASVTVEFRNNSGDVVATYTTTNTSSTAVIQTGLQCITLYYITVVVTGATSEGLRFTVSSRAVQVLVGGKQIVCIEELYLCSKHM